MITFKQYLIESRSAPLYHGTGLAELGMMMFIGKINGVTTQLDLGGTGKKAKGISSSRNYRFAMEWGKYVNRRNPNDIGFAVVHLDQSAIHARYKIVPHRYFEQRDLPRKGTDDEAEEFILAKDINFRYVTQIDYFINHNSKFVDHFIENFAKLRKKHPHIKLKMLPGSAGGK